MSLPWDELQPDQPIPAPTPEPPTPTEPISNLPERPTTEIDFTKILKDAFSQALQEAAPKLREGAKDYAKGTIDAVTHGQEVDWTHPTITATTAQGKELVVADAKSRSWRTFLQGLIFDVGFALIAVLATLSGADPFQKETWILFGTLVVKTLIQTVISYIMRLKVTPTVRPPAGEKMAVVPTFAAIPEEQRS
jgi:hypothetical protein